MAHKSDADDVGNVYQQFKFSDEDEAALTARATMYRSTRTFIADIQHFEGLLNGGSPHIGQIALLGIRHVLDETLLVMAARAAQDEDDLQRRVSFLIDYPQTLAENANLRPMLEAALVADVARIGAKTVPIELRRQFRN